MASMPFMDVYDDTQRAPLNPIVTMNAQQYWLFASDAVNVQ